MNLNSTNHHHFLKKFLSIKKFVITYNTDITSISTLIWNIFQLCTFNEIKKKKSGSLVTVVCAVCRSAFTENKQVH